MDNKKKKIIEAFAKGCKKTINMTKRTMLGGLCDALEVYCLTEEEAELWESIVEGQKE